MKSLLRIIFVLIVGLSGNRAEAQTTTTNLNILHYYLIKSTIEDRVNQEIGEWQMQGRYENTTDYKERVNSKNRENKIHELTIKHINVIASEVVHLSITSLEYDPDNEVYKISLFGLPPVYLKVPVDNLQANYFDSNQNELRFSSPEYTLTDTGFALLRTTIYNPGNKRTYYYNYQDNLIFKQNKISIEFDPVVFKTPDFRMGTTEQLDTFKIRGDINVDIDIPTTRMSQPNSIAIIIGNRDYRYVGPVEYAINDAESVKEYLVNTLGFKESNILFKHNATKSDFEEYFGNQEYFEAKLYNLVKPDISDVFIYYSGHGAPGLKNHKVYFVPVDCDPSYLEFKGYSLETFYQNLARVPARSFTVVLDACFSGEDIHKDISAVLVKVTNPVFALKSGLLLASSASSEPSYWYHDQQHGLFTYFFLRAIKEKKLSDKDRNDKLTYQEVFDYISSQTDGIPYYSRRLYGKAQNPTLQGPSDRVLVVY
jgi:hypothetical protein